MSESSSLFLFLKYIKSPSMKWKLIFLISLIISCKNQDVAKASTANRTANQLIKIADYKPSPDEVILYVKLLKSESFESVWRSEVQVLKQLQSGFGFKDHLNPEQVVILESKNQIVDEIFYCAVIHQLGIGNSKTFILNAFLTSD